MLKNMMAIASAFLFSISAAQAADYKVEFSVSGFGPVAPGMTPAPFNSAFGTAIFSAASPDATWEVLKSFNLTIGNTSYTLADAELGAYPYGNSIGGIPDTWEYLQPGANDFFVIFAPGGQGATLNYSSAARPGFWTAASQSVTFTELAVSSVPELETSAMLLAGLALTGAMARRRRLA